MESWTAALKFLRALFYKTSTGGIMNIQDKLERILRELHVMLSRAPASQLNEEYVLIPKKEMQKELGSLSQALREMMDEYEATEQGRNRGELEAEQRRMEIIRHANQQAQDIYAASVLYSEDALGRIQTIMEEAEMAAREVLKRLNREMEEEKRVVRSNQLELITQLEDMKDTAKYMKLIEERNRELARAKAQKKENSQKRRYQRKTEKDPDFQAITPEIKINEEYFEKAGLTPEGIPKEPEEKEIVYEKPVIKVNPEYFEKVRKESGEEKQKEAGEESKEEEKRQRFFSFGRK